MLSQPDRLVIDAAVSSRLSWNYENSGSALRTLYEKGKAAQWNATTDIDWSIPLEFGSDLAEPNGVSLPVGGGPVPAEQVNRFRWEYQAWMTSQFLHGEQGALVATARLVETVPDLEAKFYAASQVADEARHVEAYSRYLGILGHGYPINGALTELLGNILSESRWDMIYLGMQIIVEGLALAAFRVSGAGFADPVIRQITELVARDESRHVAFGVVSLDGFYRELTSAEVAEREEFVCEAALLMARRFNLEEIWDRMGLDVAAGVRFTKEDPGMVSFRQLLFSKIVSALRRLELLTPKVIGHFEELALIRSRSGWSPVTGRTR